MTITNPDAIENKLRMIAALSRDELAGWRWGIEMDGREPFDGEIAALNRRERELGK